MLKRITFFIISVFIFSLIGCANNFLWSDMSSIKNAHSNVEVVARTRLVSPHNIALLLPLKGRGDLAATSQAIHNGFLAAYDYARQQHADINIKLYDTTRADVTILYRQAVEDGADVVVGPLTKDEVESIAKIGYLPIPTIALNTLDNYTRYCRGNLYQFGLLPQDETVQAAEKMLRENLKQVAIVAPQNAWGEKIADMFAKTYEKYGVQVVATLNYSTSNNLAEQICRFLAIDPDKLCVYQTRKDKKQRQQEEGPMRRQDIDAIFLITVAPKQARQVVPLLKFYYANDLPIYSISTVYSGSAKPALDQDLDNVYFCDMPWVLENPKNLSIRLQNIHEQILETTIWANSFNKYNKFYALGVDAFNLAVGLNDLLNTPLAGIDSASGTLYLDKYNHIYRALQWTQFRNGVVRSYSNK